MTDNRKTYHIDKVYGITREVPLNYVARQDVDDKLVNNLTRDKHIVIHGSSKQGKTCLRKHCLEESDYIMVQCSNRWNLRELHSAILKSANFQVTESVTKTASGKSMVTASINAGFMGFGAKAGGSAEEESAASTTIVPLELDPEDANDIIRALESIEFEKYIVLEDFHYLPTETQREFSYALKAFHESSKLCFIVVGVWLEENRLIVYNGDLTGRVISVNADKWESEELKKVVEEGAKILNIRFSDEFIEALLNACFDNVYILQEACRAACESNDILTTRDEETVIENGEIVQELIQGIVNLQSGRYHAFLTNFSEGFQDTSLEMYRWLLYPLLTSDMQKLKQGLLYQEMRQMIQDRHPKGRDLNPGNLTQALQNIGSLQAIKKIQPIILDYDETNRRVNVVDRGFIIWLSNQTQEELLDTAGLADYL